MAVAPALEPPLLAAPVQAAGGRGRGRGRGRISVEDFELEDLEEMHLSLGDRTISANRPSRRTKKAKAFGEDEFGEEEWDVDSEEDILEGGRGLCARARPGIRPITSPQPPSRRRSRRAPRPRPKPRPKPQAGAETCGGSNSRDGF